MTSSLLNRIEGMFLIVNSFLPIIILIFLTTSVYLTWSNAKEAVDQYTHSLEKVIDQAKVAKSELQKASKDIAAMAINIKKNGEKIAGKISKVTTSFNQTIGGFGATFRDAVGKLSLDIKIPVIKKVVPIKFGKVLSKPMEKVGDAIAKPFKPLSNSFGELGDSVAEIKSEVAAIANKLEEIRKMEIYLDAVISEYQKIIESINQITQSIGRFFYWLAIATGIFVVWFFFGYLLWVRRRVIRGIDLIRGQAAA